MIQDLQEGLQKIGLYMNPAKTQFLTTLPGRAKRLPGVCVNEEGMNVVGRTFRLHDDTTAEINRRIRHAWAKVAKLRPILRQKTELAHRIKIVRACVYQSLLWGAEAWHITRRRCQQLRGF